MSGWVTVDEAYVLGAMPTELAGPYSAWIGKEPDKAGRLAEIVRGVVGDFRTGLRSNPTVVLDEGAGTLPERSVRHALNIIYYNLGLEMGLMINFSAQQGYINAEIYVRQLYTSEAVIDRDRLSDTPSYRRQVERPPRALA